MANEITAAAQLTFSKGGVKAQQNVTVTLTMAGTEGGTETQVIGTSAEALTFGESSGSSGPLLFVQNLDGTNYVEIAMDASVATPFAKLKAGDPPLLLPASAATIYAKANTAPVRIIKCFCDR